MSKKYELLMIFSCRSQKDVSELKQNVRSAIESKKFSIFSEQEMGRRNLAYPIEKQNEGYYHIFYISQNDEGASVNELLKDFRREKDILRSLAFVYDEEKLSRLHAKEEKFRNRKMELERKKREQANQNKASISEEDFGEVEKEVGENNGL